MASGSTDRYGEPALDWARMKSEMAAGGTSGPFVLDGHRGAKGEAPENTLAGFAHGLSQGLTAFELDVRLTSDGEIVVMHDATVDRTTDGSGAVAQLTWAQISSLDARAAFPDWPDRCPVPRLEEVLEMLPAPVRLEVEVKRDDRDRIAALVVRLASLLDRYGLAERVTVSSFEPAILEALRGRAPDLPRALIGAYDSPRFLESARALGCAQADVPLATGSAEAVTAAQAAGLRVTGWPGDTPEQLRTLLDWRVDAVTTNFPVVAVVALPLLADRTEL